MVEQKGRTPQQIIKNVFYGFSTWFLPIPLSFISVPIIVKSLGIDDFGIYSLVMGFISYSFMFNFSRALTKFLAETDAEDQKRKSEIISSTLFLNLGIGILSLTLLFVFAGWIVRDVLQIEQNQQQKTIYAIYIVGAVIFLTIISQLASALLQGIHRFDVFSKILNLSNVILILGNTLIAYLTGNLLYLLIWNGLVLFLSLLFYLKSINRLLPNLNLYSNFNWDTLKIIIQFSFSIIVYQILAHIILLFERVWVTRQFGTESLTFYVVPLVLAVYIHSFIASLILVLFPLTSELNNERDKLLRLYLKATKFIVILVVFIALTLIILSRAFLLLWLGDEFAVNSSSVMIIHIVTFSLTAILAVAWQIPEGLNNPQYNLFTFSICFVVSMVFMVVLSKPLGIFGIALGRMLGYSVLFLSIFFIEYKFFKGIQFGFWGKLTGILLISSFFTVCSELLILNYLPLNWFSLIFTALVGFIIYSLAILIFGLIGKEEKALIGSFIGSR